VSAAKRLLDDEPQVESEPVVVARGDVGVLKAEIAALARELGVDVEQSRAVTAAEAVAEDLARERRERLVESTSARSSSGGPTPDSEIEEPVATSPPPVDRDAPFVSASDAELLRGIQERDAATQQGLFEAELRAAGLVSGGEAARE
jgi:hypothetical protein